MSVEQWGVFCVQFWKKIPEYGYNSRDAVLKLVSTKGNFGHFQSLEQNADGCV